MPGAPSSALSKALRKLSMESGRSLAPGYCPACLDKWFSKMRHTFTLHPACEKVLEAKK